MNFRENSTSRDGGNGTTEHVVYRNKKIGSEPGTITKQSPSHQVDRERPRTASKKRLTSNEHGQSRREEILKMVKNKSGIDRRCKQEEQRGYCW